MINHEQLLWTASFVSVVVAISSSIACLALAWKLREAKTHQQLLAADIDHRLQEIKTNLAGVTLSTAEQVGQGRAASGRIARETVIKPEPVEPTTVSPQPAVTRESLTERRHRILTLTQRGMDTKTISARVGVPVGEVALIIRMSNPIFGE